MLVSFEEKVLATIAVLLLVAAIVIGFSDRSVAMAGAEYSCGSGFVHSEQTWRADSVGLPAGRTPISVCPSKVDRYRNIAIGLGILAVVSAVVVFGLGDRRSTSGRARYVPPVPPAA
jgi:hypothetical protein